MGAVPGAPAFSSLTGQTGGALGKAASTAGETVPLGETSLSWSGYFQALGTLFLLLAALWLLVWLLRRYGKFRFLPQPGALPRSALHLEAQLPLGPRKGVMVVRFLDKRLVLGVTDQQITLLTETDVCHEQDSAEFQEVMDAERRRKTDA